MRKEEDKILRDTMDSLQIPQTVQEKIKFSLLRCGISAADKLVQTLLLKKCQPETKEWWNILESLRNWENLPEKEVGKLIDLANDDDGAEMRKERGKNDLGLLD